MTMNNPKPINLVPIKWRKTGRESLIKKRLYLANSILSAVGILVLFAGGLYYFWKSSEYRTMLAKNEKVQENLTKIQTLEKNYLLFKNRLTAVSDIRELGNNDFFFIIRDLLLSDETQPYLSEFEISTSSAEITLVFSDPNNIDLFLETIKQHNSKSVTIDSVEKDAGNYKMKLTINN